MAAEFNWWLLIVGVVAGGALTWLVLAEFTRRDREVADEETAAEASWVARTLDDPRLDAALAEQVLHAHRRYLGFPPPDALVPPDQLPGLEEQGLAAEPPMLPDAAPAVEEAVEQDDARAPVPVDVTSRVDVDETDPARAEENHGAAPRA